MLVAAISNGTAGSKDAAAERATAAVDSEQAEAILFLATYYKKMGSYGTAEFFCNRYASQCRHSKWFLSCPLNKLH